MAASPLKGLLDKRNIALTRAKLRAWWEGVEYDEAAAVAAFEAANDAAPATEGADEQLFDALPYDMPARLTALAALWGEGRVRPGAMTADAAPLILLNVEEAGVLAVLSPGMQAPVATLAQQHSGKIQVFEWRDETLEALKHGMKSAGLDERVSISRIDLEAHVFTQAAFDGLISTDDFAYCGHPPHLAQQIMKALKPGACAVIDAYVGLPIAELNTAFASAFAEPQIRAHGDLLQVFKETGLALESDEDITESFLDLARAGFKGLGDRLTADTLNVGAAQELAWEAQAWRVRMKLMTQRRLERRRFVVRRPKEAPATPAPAPEAQNP
ncbi:MAG: hypothetical protein QM759_05075 [Terricaulis sp.]